MILTAHAIRSIPSKFHLIFKQKTYLILNLRKQQVNTINQTATYSLVSTISKDFREELEVFVERLPIEIQIGVDGIFS